MTPCAQCHWLHQACVTEKWKPGGWICTRYENDRPDLMTGEVVPYIRCYEVRAIRDDINRDCRDFQQRLERESNDTR